MTQHSEHVATHGTHTEHASHTQSGHAATWSMAAMATAHCLLGCAIGEILGMVIGAWAGLSPFATIPVAIALAFVFGYSLSAWGVLKAGVSIKQALKVALAADTISILVMEIVDNAVMVVVPGAMGAGLADWLFWASLALSFVVAFAVTTPVNKLLISRGRGHAIAHQYH